MTLALNWRELSLGVALVGLLFTGVPASWAQESSTPGTNQQPKSAGSTGTLTPDSQSDTSDTPSSSGPPTPYAPTLRDAGTGLPLFGTTSPLRWGSFSVSTFQAIGIHDSLEQPAGTIETDLAIFRLGLMFDHRLFRNSNRLVLQYFPQMALTDGRIHANGAMNNDISVGTTFRLTPRLTLALQDSFTQTHSNPLIPENYLASNGDAGAIVQNNFLDTNGSFIADQATATLEYSLSPRTIITFSPAYRYSRATNSFPSYLANAQTYTGTFSVAHRFTPSRTAGVAESIEYMKVAGPSQSSQDVLYNTISGFVSQQLARTFWIAANVGAVNQNFFDLSGGNRWGVNGGFSLIKTFPPRVSLTAAYTRGVIFANYVTLQRSDRVDGSIGFRLTSRISWTNSVGYYRTLETAPTIGKYGISGVQYRFFGNFNLFTTYAYTFQNDSTVQLIPGNRQTLAYGISWQPAALPSR